MSCPSSIANRTRSKKSQLFITEHERDIGTSLVQCRGSKNMEKESKGFGGGTRKSRTSKLGQQFVDFVLIDDDCDHKVKKEDDVNHVSIPKTGLESLLLDTIIGLKRKRYSGLDILITDNKGTQCSISGTRSVAQRTRSHFTSGTSGGKNMKLGTLTEPICFDEEESDVSVEDDRNSDNDLSADDGDESDDNEDIIGVDKQIGTEARKAGVKNKGGSKKGRPIADGYDFDDNEDGIGLDEAIGVGARNVDVQKKGASKKGRPKPESLYKILVDTMWNNCELSRQASEGNAQEKTPQADDVVTPLPRKFKFGVEVSPPKEKTDYDKYIDGLWGEFDFALKCCEMGSFNSAVKEDNNEPEIETDQCTLCHRGKHLLILDEEIGIKCSFCSFVKLEIKYVQPPLIPCQSGRTSMNINTDDWDFSTLDRFQFQKNDVCSRISHTHLKGTVWDKFPGIRNMLYPHQQEGFEFLWKNLAGGIELDKLVKNASSDGVGGCVISHAPGTGKTLLTIAFLMTYMEVYKECRPIIIAPCSMLLTWGEEFRKWKVDVPFHNLNSSEYSGKEHHVALELTRKYRGKKWTRLIKLYSWSKGKGILGISYPLFERLAGRRPVDAKEAKSQRDIQRFKQKEDVRKILLEKPSLLVLDEGHTPRNERSHIWKALENIKTERRIILSGTPFQNNFDELFNTMCLVKPKFTAKISFKTQKIDRRTLKGRESKDSRGKWTSLTNTIGKLDDDVLLEEVRSMISPFVHVHRGDILRQNLPGLRDCVVVLHPTPLQKDLLKGIEGIQDTFKREHTLSLVSVHPSLKAVCCYSENDKDIINKVTLNSFRLNPNEGVKTRFLMELIRLSQTLNEKVLVFSQFIDPFILIKDQLQSLFNWTEGKEVLQMDGKQNVKIRQKNINLFNDPTSQAKVLLASIKACREGINLIGASRIVLLDVVWNPSVERQAISRAYRLGQKKVVYTYHLITAETMEEDKYCRQVEKDRLSKLMFFSTTEMGSEQKSSLSVSDDSILEKMVDHEKLKEMFKTIIYQPKESNLVDTFGSVGSATKEPSQ
ncbi:hypothetical protein GIB67_029249 [Kingdonia uniflora]|uniref:Uncharacterized protein n=1 Tax=Kingdonia uniflora TaxID=39325 RepID=A0A7J7N8Q9_9MAGN|nr:hypothetical protein GIB67_029249 [Kingdonia uniflora]